MPGLPHAKDGLQEERLLTDHAVGARAQAGPTNVEALHQEGPSDQDAGHSQDAEHDGLYQEVEAEQAGYGGPERADRDEDGEERNRDDLDDHESNGDDHPEPERRHPRPFYGLRDADVEALGGFGLQPAACVPLDRDRHDPGAPDYFEPPGQPDILPPGGKVDADHRHGGVAVGTTGGADCVGRIPGALSACAAAPADEIEHHPLVSADRRGYPTSLHRPTTVACTGTLLCNLPPPLRRRVGDGG